MPTKEEGFGFKSLGCRVPFTPLKEGLGFRVGALWPWQRRSQTSGAKGFHTPASRTGTAAGGGGVVDDEPRRWQLLVVAAAICVVVLARGSQCRRPGHEMAALA